MSHLISKAKKTIKKKAGDMLDRLRPPSRQSRSTSPDPSPQDVHSANLETESNPSPAIAVVIQTPISPTQVSNASLHPAGPATIDSQPSADSTALASTFAHEEAPSAPTILTTTGLAVKGLLVAARDGSDLFLPLKAALVGVVALWDVCDRTAEAKVEFKKLESKLKAINSIAAAHRDEADKALQVRLGAIVEAIRGLWEAVEQRQARGIVMRMAQSAIDLDDIKALNSAILSLLDLFQFEGGIVIQKELGHIAKRLDANENERKERDRVKKQEQAMNTIRSVLGDNFISQAADDEQPNYAGCMAGTRVGVLSKFITWIKNDPMAIFWLAGMAGTGKTSIAVSLCRMLRDDPAVFLGGGYFCSRTAGSIARTDVRCILPTLATLLAGKSQKFAAALAEQLEKDPRVGHKPVGEQLDPLLRRPLAVLDASTRPIVFVIDALDECGNERELAELLKLLADLQFDGKVKFILTSRPELHIRGTPISNSAHNTILQLHTIDADEVTSDIRVYIRGTLEDTAAETTWYTEKDVELLVKLSGGLFIFASTVLRYVLDPDDNEERQGRLLKVTSTTVKRNAATTAVDNVYELVLTDVTRDDMTDPDELETTRRILASILIVRQPLSVEALAALMEIKPGRLRASLRRLHSLVYIPPDDAEPGVRTLHASFGDYLFDRATVDLRVTAALGHDALARGCLRRFARDDLCFNLSRSPSSFEPNVGTTPAWISLSLIYACLHWAHHIDASSNRRAFNDEIDKIFRKKFLFWLEILSVMGKIGVASGLLRIAGSAVNEQVVSQFLRDANVFVASSHEAISRSVPHIYLSALPFAAKDSLVFRDFDPLCIKPVSVTATGIDQHGGQLVTTLTAHADEVRSVAYSPDGHFLSSGSVDGTIRIWNTRTGEEILSTLPSDDGAVYSVAFAPNGQCVASGTSSGVVHVWNISTGRAALPPLHGHNSPVQSVAFSPDGMLIASASEDATIRLWSADTGHKVFVMSGHTQTVLAIAFSPDGRILASASIDKTVRLWGPNTGEALGDPLIDLEDEILCLSFSPDGKWLAAGSRHTFAVRIWDVSTRQPTRIVIRDQSSVSSIAFSPDGLILALSVRSAIRCWDPQSGHELARSSFSSHTNRVRSIAFSPDGLFLASGSADRTVRLWDVSSIRETASQPLLGHTGAVNSVAVSPDGTLIVSASHDRSVGVWDLSTGQAKPRPLLGHSHAVVAVAISPTGHLIASASADCTIRLWDTQTGDSVGEPLHGHTEWINAVKFSVDTRWIAAGSDDKTVRIWDVATGQLATFGLLQCAKEISSLAFSLDGRLFAAADLAGWIYFWQPGTDQPARTSLQAKSRSIYCLAFSPDSTRLSSGAADNFIRIWDVADGHKLMVLKGHVNVVRSVAYSPDGRYIVSASRDKTIRLWDAEAGNSVASFFGHGDQVLSVAFTPNGRSIVSGSSDATIHAWDVEAALALPSQSDDNVLARLGAATLRADGWLVGPQGELLLWLPERYRGYILLPPCSMLIGSYQVILNAGEDLHWGNQWAACWRAAGPPAVSPSQ